MIRDVATAIGRIRPREMKKELPDRSQILFGRKPYLDHLLQRTVQPSLTAAVERSLMGKRCLLTKLARQLSITKPSSPVPSILERPPVSVGLTEALGETADLLLRCIVDLYSGWLSHSTYCQQARIVYHSQRQDFIGRAGDVVGYLFEKISKTAYKPGEAVGGLVKETLQALASANRDLLGGAIQLPRLQIEQARPRFALLSQAVDN